MKKTLLIGTLLIATTLTLSACGTSTSPSSTVTVTEQPTYDPAPVLTDEDVFLANLHSQGNLYIDSASDSALLEVGHQTCDMLDQGYTVTDLVTYLAGTGNFDDPEAAEAVGLMMGAGIAAFCPQYVGQVPGY